MAALEAALAEAERPERASLIATDGVFSMDGYLATCPPSATSPTRTTRW